MRIICHYHKDDDKDEEEKRKETGLERFARLTREDDERKDSEAQGEREQVAEER